jgi:hypothetical protein
VIKFHGLQPEDKKFFVASIVIPIVLWWIFTGSKRYSAKGMH